MWCFRANAEGADGAVSGHGTVGTGVFDRSMTRLPQETPPVAGEITNVFEGRVLRPPAHKGRCPKGSITIEVTRVVPTQPVGYCLPYQHITSTIASSPHNFPTIAAYPRDLLTHSPLTKTSLFDQRPFPNGSLSTASLSHATFWLSPLAQPSSRQRPSHAACWLSPPLAAPCLAVPLCHTTYGPSPLTNATVWPSSRLSVPLVHDRPIPPGGRGRGRESPLARAPVTPSETPLPAHPRPPSPPTRQPAG